MTSESRHPTAHISDSPDDTDDPWDIHFKICYYCMIPVTALIFAFNFPIITSIIYNKKLHFPTFYFVLSLALADFCVGVTCLGKLIDPHESTYNLCLLRFAFLVGPVCVSVWCLFWIALDRYLCIRIPLKYHTVMTTFKAAVAIVITWIYAFIIGFLPLMGWNLGDESARCSFLYVVHPHYVWFAFVAAFTFPLVANVVIYVNIFIIARKHIRKISTIEIRVNGADSSCGQPRVRVSVPPNKNITEDLSMQHRTRLRKRRASFLQSSSFPRTIKAVKTLLVVLGCFLLTWGPFAVANIVQQICGYDSCDIRGLIGTYLLLLGYCNSFLNPLIYGFWNRDFRFILKESVSKIAAHFTCTRCCKEKRKVSVVTACSQIEYCVETMSEQTCKRQMSRTPT